MILCKIFGHNWIECYSGKFKFLISRLCKRCKKVEAFETDPIKRLKLEENK